MCVEVNCRPAETPQSSGGYGMPTSGKPGIVGRMPMGQSDGVTQTGGRGINRDMPLMSVSLSFH